MKKGLTLLLVALVASAMVFAAPAKEKASSGLTGKVTIYTPDSDVCQDALRQAVAEKYPDLELDIVSGGMSELSARIKSEAGSPVCDVAWGAFAQGDGDAFYPLIDKYVTKEIGDATVVDPNEYYNYYISEIPVLIVNTKLEKELGIEINSYADLLKPELKGKIISADPCNSSSAWKQLLAILAVYGGYENDAAWDYVKQLQMQFNGAISSSSSNCYKLVISGEYVVGLSYESGVLTQLINGAKDVKMVYPSDGTIQSCFAVSKVKNCPNPEAAEAIIDVLCSTAYQDIVSETAGARGTNKNTKPVNGAKPISEINIVDIDLDDYAAHKDFIQDKWRDLWASVN